MDESYHHTTGQSPTETSSAYSFWEEHSAPVHILINTVFVILVASYWLKVLAWRHKPPVIKYSIILQDVLLELNLAPEVV